MKYDPNLRGAMDEIREILKRRNIGGHVLLASPTNTEYELMYDIPIWSAIKIEKEDDQIGIRIKAKKSIPGDHEKLKSTMHMLCSFHDILANGVRATDYLISMVRKHGITVLHRNMIGEEPDSIRDE